MRFSWKTIDDVHQAEAGDKTYHVKKSPSGAVWELFELVSPATHGLPRAMTCRYLTNAKSLASAKKIASDLHNGRAYLDEECVPRKIEQKDA